MIVYYKIITFNRAQLYFKMKFASNTIQYISNIIMYYLVFISYISYI